jgi:hypothetical protein
MLSRLRAGIVSRRRSVRRRSAQTNRSRRATRGLIRNRMRWWCSRMNSLTKSRRRRSRSARNRPPNRRHWMTIRVADIRWVPPCLAPSAGSCHSASAHRRRRRPPACPSAARRHDRIASPALRRSVPSEPIFVCRIRGWVCSSWSVDHAGGVERTGGKRGKAEPDRCREFAGRDPRRQVRHRDLDDVIDRDLHDQRDRAPD